ncbi:siderophore-interacting protein [Thermobifida alba]|jgi:NADPH-dependent ferric siderophore reductase|uniref:Siderophore-interacting protein n=1 Tax=Thermobifida alba TaxID=53522 RepID=A0ABY4L2Z1_THEAE|nr:siderophore-interacting protein [Thermobifida alba]UPT20843.1 siderophore-interacting protein [Thermobifida alba]HLU98161.1 siderophore-interacting protein [Thermobifida alba]
MTERPARRNPRVTCARVQRVERLTPHMVRVVLGGPGLADFTAGQYTDHYVKLLFPPENAPYRVPFDLQKVREELPRELWPAMRTYTVRRWDAERRELTLDVVHHGPEGIAGPWAARVQVGEQVCFAGPGGGYAPDPDADWHLLVGDESALPAVAASLERLPYGALAHVFLEVSGPEEEQKLETAADASVTWLHRGGARVGEALVRAVGGLEFPPGRVHAFVHGEAGFVKELRALLRKERGVPREDLSISGYWRLGLNEDGWQSTKREWNRRVEQEQEGA